MNFPAPVALDVETHGTRKETGDPRIAPFLLAAIAPHNVVTRRIPVLSERAKVTVHNSPYDSVVCGEWDCEWDDTKMVAHLLGEPDTSLKGLVSRHLNKPAFTEGYADPERMAEQCMWDAANTWELFPVIYDKLSEGERELYETLEKPLLPLWCQMTLNGSYGLDMAGLEAYRDSVALEIDELESELKLELPDVVKDERYCLHCALWEGDKEEGSKCRPRPKKSGEGETTLHKWAEAAPKRRQVNLNSPSQLLECLNTLGISARDTEAATLQLLARSHSVVGKILAYRKHTKELSTYVLPWLEKDGLLGAIWNPTGTWTGRVSSREPNLQNVPSRLERFFLPPRDGWVMLTFDNAQLEVRVAAHISGDPLLGEACRSEDFHGRIQEEFRVDDRRRAKNYIFGTMYLGGEQALMWTAQKAGLNLSWDEARAIQRAVRARAAVYFNWAESTSKKRIVQGLFGRTHRIPEGDEEHMEKEAVNAPIQGGAADITKQQMLTLWKAGYWVLAQVHDSITVCVPESEVDNARIEVPRTMESVVDWDVPLKVEEKT